MKSVKIVDKAYFKGYKDQSEVQPYIKEREKQGYKLVDIYTTKKSKNKEIVVVVEKKYELE